MMESMYPYLDKNTEISLYCESGNRSMMAKQLMDKAGFKKVTDAGSIDNLK